MKEDERLKHAIAELERLIFKKRRASSAETAIDERLAFEPAVVAALALTLERLESLARKVEADWPQLPADWPGPSIPPPLPTRRRVNRLRQS